MNKNIFLIVLVFNVIWAIFYTKHFIDLLLFREYFLFSYLLYGFEIAGLIGCIVEFRKNR